jgi:O-antigen/teichoic acid export membrane protein
VISQVRRLLARGSLGAFLLKAASGSAVIQVCNLGLGFLVGVQLARGLGADGYGIYGLAMSVIALLMIPSEFGLPSLVVREVASGLARGWWGRVRGVISWSTKVAVRTSLASCLLVALLVMFNVIANDSTFATTLFIGVAMIPLVAIGKTMGAALRGFRHIVAGQLPNSVLRPAVTSALLFALYLYGLQLTPELAMFMGVVGAAAAMLLGLLMLRRVMPGTVRAASPEIRSKEWRESCIPFAMTESMRVIQGHISVLLLGAMAPAAAVGIYKVATAFNVLVLMPITVIVAVISPTVASLFSAGDTRRLQKVASWSSVGATLGSVAISLPMLVAGYEVMGVVFGEGYSAAVRPLQVLCIGGVMTASAGPAGTLLNMTGNEKVVRKASFWSLVLLIVILPPLVWLAEEVGAAIATVIAGVVWRMWMVASCRILIGVDPSIIRILIGRGAK